MSVKSFFCLGLLSCGAALFGGLFTVTSIAQNSVNPLFVFKHLELVALRQSVSMPAAESGLSMWLPVGLIWQAACCCGQRPVPQMCDRESVLSASLPECLLTSPHLST